MNRCRPALVATLAGLSTLLAATLVPATTAQAQAVNVGGIKARVLEVGRDLFDDEGVLTSRYDAQSGTVYLLRPDQHVAARWRAFDAAAVQAALQRALCIA